MEVCSYLKTIYEYESIFGGGSTNFPSKFLLIKYEKLPHFEIKLKLIAI